MWQEEEKNGWFIRGKTYYLLPHDVKALISDNPMGKNLSLLTASFMVYQPFLFYNISFQNSMKKNETNKQVETKHIILDISYLSKIKNKYLVRYLIPHWFVL